METPSQAGHTAERRKRSIGQSMYASVSNPKLSAGPHTESHHALCQMCSGAKASGKASDLSRDEWTLIETSLGAEANKHQ